MAPDLTMMSGFWVAPLVGAAPGGIAYRLIGGARPDIEGDRAPVIGGA